MFYTVLSIEQHFKCVERGRKILGSFWQINLDITVPAFKILTLQWKLMSHYYHFFLNKRVKHISRRNKMLQYLTFYLRLKLLIPIPIHSRRWTVFYEPCDKCFEWRCTCSQHRVLNWQVSSDKQFALLKKRIHVLCYIMFRVTICSHFSPDMY